jgi:hypothetical protein
MITIDWPNKIVNSTSSILDLPDFKDEIRDLEDDAMGVLFPPVISYKKVDLGGGAFFHAVDLINGYQLRFPNAGNYEIVGNLGGNIIPVSGVYVERKTSAAFSTSGSGGGGSSVSDIYNANKADYMSPGTMGELLNNVEKLSKQIKALTSAGL